MGGSVGAVAEPTHLVGVLGSAAGGTAYQPVPDRTRRSTMLELAPEPEWWGPAVAFFLGG